ncbi:MAG: iron ABC transporter permease [Anaerolineae bacterium]|nr:iron ABC transporter permease [Anaerolineae bacterium]MBN8619022.1 iron ABC transporter permease [Anaerolineae bacterium]
MSVQTKVVSRNTTRILGSRSLLLPGLVVGVVVLVGGVLWSITLGAADITPDTVYAALFNFDSTSFQHLIIQTVRLPRVLTGVIVGASLAVAGAIMQGLTRNPLADSGILGINSGASFAVVMGVFLLGNPPLSLYAILAFIGAGLASGLVYMLGAMGRGGATPLKLTLAGVILSAFISSFTTAILIGDQETLDKIRFWTAGSLAGRDMALLTQTAPYMLAGLAGAFFISRQITTISLGEDVAKGLGQQTGWVKVLAAVVVVMLAGGAVSLAGPIGFVGLVVPHVVRFMVGVDYRWVVPYSAVLGGILVTVADVGARVIIRPQELPVGVVMAIVGAPFFIWLARWKVKR